MDDVTLVVHWAANVGMPLGGSMRTAVPREVIEAARRVERQPQPVKAPSCSQCGQRTPICATCGDSIIHIPQSGFGRDAAWQHLAPPRRAVPDHMIVPKVFVT